MLRYSVHHSTLKSQRHLIIKKLKINFQIFFHQFHRPFKIDLSMKKGHENFKIANSTNLLFLSRSFQDTQKTYNQGKEVNVQPYNNF